MMDLPKTYDPKAVEDEISRRWEQSGKYNPDHLDLPKNAEPFSIILPPPNATGQLHLGHAMYVIQDIMIRHARMQGRRALWLPGTDHAAIAVNAIIEKQLRDEGKTREQIGREAFMKRVGKFIATSQGRIKTQLKKMGFSLDWSREAYTLDEQRSKVVAEVFQRMYKDGLIYRGVRVINWDPIAKSAISDDEVQYKEQETTLYTFRYANNFPIPISTTRPETKVGDTAVAVHPKDPRYQKYIGKEFDLEFAGARLHLRVVADEQIDPKFGTGALGVTPSHSIVDSEIAKTNALPFVTVIQEDGTMSPNAGFLLAGCSTQEARAKVVAWLKEHHLLEAEETIQHHVSLSERTGAVVEPLPKEQWFIDVNKPFAFRQSKLHPIKGLKDRQKVTLKHMMRHVVESRQIRIVPDRFNKTYFQWIDHLRDWNISRQIWFGHRVPVWYCVGDEREGSVCKLECRQPVVQPVAPTVCRHCGSKNFEQDHDTLDTWFSSGTWTFSTLGWPERTRDLKTFHPTSVLETGYDILFFWVARMILMTTYALGEVPFRKVYLHGLVRDKHGAKMSKSKGNGIDPLEMIQKYGTDAVRLSLVSGTTPGNDTRLYEEKIAGYRNFINKFWNISRYILSTVDHPRYISNPIGFSSKFLKTFADHWIEQRLSETIQDVSSDFSKHQYGLAIEKLYAFTWNDLADWYLEIVKIKKGKDELLLSILSVLLRLWHPYVPFITEHIYQQLGGHGATLMIEPWPTGRAGRRDQKAIKLMYETQKIITLIRKLRADLHIPFSVVLTAKGKWSKKDSQKNIIEQLGKLKFAEHLEGKTFVIGSGLKIQLKGVVDIAKELANTKKEIQEKERYLKSLEAKLMNKSFFSKAPKGIVEEVERKLDETRMAIKELQEKINHLKKLSS